MKLTSVISKEGLLRALIRFLSLLVPINRNVGGKVSENEGVRM